MLGLVHPLPQRFHRIAFADGNRFLEEDGTRVQLVGHDVNGGTGDRCPAGQRTFDGVHPASELGQEGWMDVDDAVGEPIQKRLRVNPVIAGIDHQLDVVSPKEVTHREVALLRGIEALLRQLSEWDVFCARKRCRSARRAIGRHGDDVDPTLDEIAEIGALARDANSDFQRISTRSGPV